MHTSLKRSLAGILLTAVLFSACGPSNDISEQYPISKKYWDASDYKNVIFTIKHQSPDAKQPCYSDPRTSVVFTKLVDKNNASVVFEDESLGISHRSEFGEAMFQNYQDMEEAYSGMDREDKYIYPMELIDIAKFGLYVQRYYFELGNEDIKKRSDDPNSQEIVDLVNKNMQTLADNYSNYLNYTKDESGLSAEALKAYVDGIREYFPPLIEKYPSLNYDDMSSKAEAMIGKAKSAELKAALNDIIARIKPVKEKQAAEKMAADSAAAATPPPVK